MASKMDTRSELLSASLTSGALADNKTSSSIATQPFAMFSKNIFPDFKYALLS